MAHLLRDAGDELFEKGRYLVLGGAIAAALQSAVSPALLLTFRQGIVLPSLVTMTLAMVLSICSDRGLLRRQLRLSALLAFLVFGPIIDMQSTLMFTTTFWRLNVAGIVVLTALLFLGLTTALQLKGWT